MRLGSSGTIGRLSRSGTVCPHTNLCACSCNACNGDSVPHFPGIWEYRTAIPLPPARHAAAPTHISISTQHRPHIDYKMSGPAPGVCATASCQWSSVHTTHAAAPTQISISTQHRPHIDYKMSGPAPGVRATASCQWSSVHTTRASSSIQPCPSVCRPSQLRGARDLCG